jgi:hypothetical protein
MYVQEFFFNLWLEKEVSFEALDRVDRDRVEKRIPEYSYVWNSLFLNQKRALKLIAHTAGETSFTLRTLIKWVSERLHR